MDNDVIMSPPAEVPRVLTITPECNERKKRKYSSYFPSQDKGDAHDCDDDDNTIHQKNQTLTRTRCTMKVTVSAPDTQYPITILEELIKSFLQGMKDEDPSFQILPWRDSDKRTHQGIGKSADVQKKMPTMKIYLPRVRHLPQGGVFYSAIQVQHTKPLEDITSTIGYFLQSHELGLWPRSIQVEEIAEVGWLLYSTSKMNKDLLQSSLSKLTGYRLGLVDRMINMGVRGPVDKDQKTRALHVECDISHKLPLKRKLDKILSSTRSTMRPLGIRLRFVPHVSFLL